jgi:putative flippase GtrA
MLNNYLHILLLFFSSFLIDLGLLWLFLDVLQIELLIATAFSFLIAVSINYVSNRRWVFKGTRRSIAEGYINFVSIALLGLVLIVGLMWFFVHKLDMDIVLARIITALFVGIWNFVMNKKFNLGS